MTDPNLSLVLDELENAKRKHPHFVDHFFLSEPLFGLVGFVLDDARRLLKARADAGIVNFEAVLRCEVWEAIEAYEKGDFAHARQELAQCAAVCIRGMEYVEKEMAGQHATKERARKDGE